jgi:hypothetical protein
MNLTLRAGYGNFRLNGQYLTLDHPVNGIDGDNPGGFIDFSDRPPEEKALLSNNSNAQTKAYAQRTLAVIYSDYTT